MGVSEEAPAAIDGPGGELRKEQQEVEPVLKPEVLLAYEAVVDLDDHLGGLERHVGDAHEAPEALIEDCRDLVDHKRRERCQDGHRVGHAPLGVTRQGEGGHARHHEEGKKRHQLGRRLEEDAGQEEGRENEPPVPEVVLREAEGRSGNDACGEQHEEAWVSEKRHGNAYGRQTWAASARRSALPLALSGIFARMRTWRGTM